MESHVETLIASLELVAHPEGGWFREVFRSEQATEPGDGRGERAALSVIYFLLARGERSRWHGLRSDEQWTFLEGDPLALYLADLERERKESVLLGPPGDGHLSTTIVQAGVWQAARTTGAYTLVTCTVGPGFEFQDFRFLEDDPLAAQRLASEWPEAAAFL